MRPGVALLGVIANQTPLAMGSKFLSEVDDVFENPGKAGK